MNQFLAFPGTNYTNIVVFKNGFSTLGAISYYLHFKKELSLNDSVWSNLKKRKILFGDYNKTDKLFFVWRDPFDRMLSLFKDLDNHKMIKNHLKNSKDFKEFLKFYTIKSKLDNADSHYKRQHIFLKNFKNSSILIVKIEDLPEFAKHELNYENFVIRNKSEKNNIENNLKKFDQFFKTFKELFKEEFKEDYEILNNYPVYCPPCSQL